MRLRQGQGGELFSWERSPRETRKADRAGWMLEPTKALLVFMLPPDQKDIFFNFLTDSSGRVSCLLGHQIPYIA
jgi:hypothetical protein